MTDLFCEQHYEFKEIVEDNPNYLFCWDCEYEGIMKTKKDEKDNDEEYWRNY